MARDKAGHHEQIMAAAWQEFLTYGFADASMRRIAAAACISTFPAKKRCSRLWLSPRSRD